MSDSIKENIIEYIKNIEENSENSFLKDQMKKLINSIEDVEVEIDSPEKLEMFKNIMSIVPEHLKRIFNMDK